MIELGLTAESDAARAGHLYLQTAKAGYPASFNRVGLMYYRGELGVKRGENQAAEYFREGQISASRMRFLICHVCIFRVSGVSKDE